MNPTVATGSPKARYVASSRCATLPTWSGRSVVITMVRKKHEDPGTGAIHGDRSGHGPGVPRDRVCGSRPCSRNAECGRCQSRFTCDVQDKAGGLLHVHHGLQSGKSPAARCGQCLETGRFGEELRLRSLLFIEGVGQHPSNRWPPEPSFLVLDLSLEAAKALGSRHEQNAIVWCGADATPLLVLLR